MRPSCRTPRQPQPLRSLRRPGLPRTGLILLTIVGLLASAGTGLQPLRGEDDESWLFDQAPASGPDTRLPLTAPSETLVTRFDFEAGDGDVNYDLWPDDWTRREGKGFPNYVKIGLAPVADIRPVATQGSALGAEEEAQDAQPPSPISPPPIDLGEHSLRVELDGGAAEITSPRIPITSHFSYALQGWILLTPSRWHEQNEAWISMTLLNRDGTVTQTYRTSRLNQVGAWTRVELGPVVPQDPQFQYLTLTLHVHPTRAEDIFGQAWFDGLEILHLPKLNAVVNKPFHFYTTGEQVEIACSVSGMQTNDAQLTFQLIDVRREVVLERRLNLVRGALRLEDDPGGDPSTPAPPSQAPTSPDNPATETPPSDQRTDRSRGSMHLASAVLSNSETLDRMLPASFKPEPRETLRSYSRQTTEPRQPEAASLQIAPDIRRDVGEGEWIRWTPEVTKNGYYRAVVVLSNNEGLRLARELPFVIAPPAPRGRSLQFGWNVPRQSTSVSLQDLVSLFHESGVQWVMYPVWYAASREEDGQRIGELAERLTMERMEMIALLDAPPLEQSESFSRVEQGISATLRDKEVWLPALQHVLTRLSFKINWWQLGAPEDMSFVGQPSLERKIELIRESLQRFGKNIRVGYTWNLLHETPWLTKIDETNEDGTASTSADPWRDSQAAWDYLLRHHETPLTAKEIQSLVRGSDRVHGPVWITLQPLDNEHYDLTTRVRDLIERMVSARVSGADVVLVPEPFSSYHGLINDDLSPTELLLPFRTASFQLADTEFVGRLELPGKSPNYLFRRGSEVVMVVWNDTPTTENLSLGTNIRVLDCWGRQAELPVEEGRAAIPVSREPRFVTGLEYELVQWQMKTQLDRDLIESEIGKEQTLGVRFENTLPDGVAGTVTLYCEELWDGPQVQNFKATSNEQFELQFPLALRSSVGTSRQEIVISFDVRGIQRHRFQVRRTVDVGIKDIRIDTAVQREGNNILVHATLVNETDEPVSFNLFLFAPDRKRQRTQILQLESGRQRRTFVVEDADDILGKNLWIRAEEMRGTRVLNYQIDTPPQLDAASPPTETDAATTSPPSTSAESNSEETGEVTTVETSKEPGT